MSQLLYLSEANCNVDGSSWFKGHMDVGIISRYRQVSGCSVTHWERSMCGFGCIGFE